MDEKDCLMLQYLSQDGSLTKAAERLYTTQPALTYRLRQIEKEFGVPVIVKNGKGIKLTQEGEYLVTYSQKLLLFMRNAKDHVVNMRNEVEGNLRIGVSSYYGLYKLPNVLKDFLNQYPKVQINVDSGWSAEVFELLLQEDIHVGIVKGDYQWYDQKYLMSEENICMISREKIDLDSLPKLPRINFKLSKRTGSFSYSSLSQTIDDWWHERFKESPLITMQVDSYETCKEMVKNGYGYAFIPKSFLHSTDELYWTDLIRKNGQAIKRNTWMLYRESSMQLSIVERFVNYIKNLP